jgi:uncharacterized protein
MIKKIILGTVQFGLNYGINNISGQPSKDEMFCILDEASKQGIDCLDTADAYGNAIELIGQYHQSRNNRFKMLSKFKGIHAGQLNSQVKNALNVLHVSSFEVYSYHSFADYLNQSYLKDELQTLKNQGLIKKIGISIYTNEELQHVIIDENIDVIQFPYNLLDNQNIRGIYLEQAKQNHKEIHVRSVFLQGLFFKNLKSLPEKLKPLSPYLQIIHNYCQKNSISLETLALSYALCNEHIDHVLIGVDTQQQLLNNLSSIMDLGDNFEFINQQIQVKETELLNPVNWK